MRRVTQIQVSGNELFALTADGMIWNRVKNADGWDDWKYIDNPPEGNPPEKPISLEEQAAKLNESANRTFVGRGHHLSKGEK